MGEPEVVHAAIPAGASILELGAGAGRMTHRLVELGHPVVAVDESPEMLARIRGSTPAPPAEARSPGTGPTPAGAGATPTQAHPAEARSPPTQALTAEVRVETVRARIQGLDLGRRFDVVLLASFLVNTADDGLRRRFLVACRGHVGEGGCVLVQRHAPGWFDEAAEGEWTSGGVTFRLRDLRRPGPACSRPRPSTRSGSGCGRTRSRPGGSTTGSWRPPWPKPGWPSTPT